MGGGTSSGGGVTGLGTFFTTSPELSEISFFFSGVQAVKKRNTDRSAMGNFLFVISYYLVKAFGTTRPTEPFLGLGFAFKMCRRCKVVGICSQRFDTDLSSE